MKVKVISAFKDKYTGKTHKIGEEMEATVDRVNEIIRAGKFIQIMPEQSETADQGKADQDAAPETAEQPEQSEPDAAQEGAADQGAGQADAVKRTGRRSRK